MLTSVLFLEANQKGWCDKATADATQKRQYAADEIEGLRGPRPYICFKNSSKLGLRYIF